MALKLTPFQPNQIFPLRVNTPNRILCATRKAPCDTLALSRHLDTEQEKGPTASFGQRQESPARPDGNSTPDLAGDRIHDHVAGFLSGASCRVLVVVRFFSALAISRSRERIDSMRPYDASFLNRTDTILGLTWPFGVRAPWRSPQGISVILPLPRRRSTTTLM